MKAVPKSKGSLMDARVLAYDPSPEGRRLIRQGLRSPEGGWRLLIRASLEKCLSTLGKMPVDALVLGLPIEPAHLFQLLATTRRLALPPLWIALGDTPARKDSEGWMQVPKGHEGLEDLCRQMRGLLRIHRLRNLERTLTLPGSAGRESAVRRLVDIGLDGLRWAGFQPMYFAIDPHSRRWTLRGSGYPPAIQNAILELSAGLGGVAPRVEDLSPALADVVRGRADLQADSLADILQAIMPGGAIDSLEKLLRREGVHALYLAPVAGEGILAIGERPAEVERLALRAFSGHWGDLLRQARTLDLLSRRAQALSGLQQVSLKLSSTRDPDALLGEVLALLEEVVPFDAAAVLLEQGGRLTAQGERLRQLDVGGRILGKAVLKGSGNCIDEALAARSPMRLDDLDSRSVMGEGGLWEGIRSWLCIPIYWQTSRMGVLLLGAGERGYYSQSHLEVAEQFARQLGVALENARLLKTSAERSEKLHLVGEIGRFAVSILDTQQLAREVALRVLQIFACDVAGIMLLDDGTLRSHAFLAAPGGRDLRGLPDLVLADMPAIARALHENRSLRLGPASESWDLIRLSTVPEDGECWVIPLSAAAEVMGALFLFGPREGTLSPEELDVLEVLAGQLAISLVNARLFGEIRAYAAQLEVRVAARTEELHAAKERTEAILRSVGDPVLVLDLRGELLLVNPRAQALLEGPFGEMLTDRIRRLLAADGQTQENLEVGDATLQAMASPVEWNGRAIGTVVVLRDITRLRELDRLKSQFVATVSHELRTPLTNIKLYLGLLRRARGVRVEKYFEVMDRETARLSQMIEDLLDISRLEAGERPQLEAFSLGALLAEIAENHRPACVDKRLDFDLQIGQDMMIEADMSQILRVLTNLLSNAIAYTPAGGKVRLELVGEEQVGGKRHAKVVVEDTGIGIDKDDMPHIFDRFYRGSLAREHKIHGSGLGLAIVREILDNHHARIAVDSEPGRGSRFTLWLPCEQETERTHG